MYRASLLMLAFCAAAASAQPMKPADRGDSDAFRAAAAAQYTKILAGQSAKGRLDDDAILLDRVRRIAAGLIRVAGQVRPETSAWSWEVHVTSDASVGAFCMAGGKLLIGSAMVRRLDLSDAELAMLLGHEIAHAVAGHRREAARSTMDGDAAEEIRQTRIAVTQEDEADRIGMDLAYRAGWPESGLLTFFEKLSAEEPPGTFNSSHPTARSRAEAAQKNARRGDSSSGRGAVIRPEVSH